MHSSTGLLALAALLSSAQAATFGFNYGAQWTDDSAKTEADFAKEFEAAKKLPGVNGAFTSARLYTMLQHGTSDEVIQAIPAAIESNTHLLLGLWASGDPAGFKNEIAALKKAIQQYPKFTDLVDGISVGSEDLYRISEIGLKAPDAAPGQGPEVLENYIKQTRDAIKGTSLSGAKVGHVDTWTAWANSSNAAVAQASDFIGFDAYPYFQDTISNGIDDSLDLFEDAIAETRKYTGDVPIWIAETGWPISGPKKNLANANTKEAKAYWDKVACKYLADDNMNMWWYTLHDASPTTPSPSFGILPEIDGEPAFDLSCKDVDTSSKSSSKPSTRTGTAAGSSGTADSGSPANSASGSADASFTATASAGSGSGSGSGAGGYATGAAPIATGTAGASGAPGAGAGGAGNGTAPTAGVPGAPGAGGDTPVQAGTAAIKGVSAALAGAAALAAMLL